MLDSAASVESKARSPSSLADQVLDSLRPLFDDAAAALTECAKLVPAHGDPVDFLEHADADAQTAWRDISKLSS